MLPSLSCKGIFPKSSECGYFHCMLTGQDKLKNELHNASPNSTWYFVFFNSEFCPIWQVFLHSYTSVTLNEGECHSTWYQYTEFRSDYYHTMFLSQISKCKPLTTFSDAISKAPLSSLVYRIPMWYDSNFQFKLLQPIKFQADQFRTELGFVFCWSCDPEPRQRSLTKLQISIMPLSVTGMTLFSTQVPWNFQRQSFGMLDGWMDSQADEHEWLQTTHME